MIILQTNGNGSNGFSAQSVGSWATLAASTPIFLSSFFMYLYRSFRENFNCRELIKPSRAKYYHSGLLSAFCLFSTYLILWLVAFKIGNGQVVWYIALPLIMVFGLITLVYLSLYEFCVSFDIMYSQNKKELVHNLLERVAKKKIEIVEDE